MKRFFVALFAGALLALPVTSHALAVKSGKDALKTTAGKLKLNELKNANGGPLKLKLKGKPLKNKKKPGAKKRNGKFGKADTKLKRKGKVKAKSKGEIPIELVALSLKSKEPVKVKKNRKNRGKFNAKVKLGVNPKLGRKAAQGKLNIKKHKDKKQGRGTLTNLPSPRKKDGGTFDLHIDALFLHVDLIPVGGNDSDPISHLVELGGLTSNSGTWSHRAPPFYPTIPNLPGTRSGISAANADGSGNFFVTGPVELSDANGLFSVTFAPAVASEPLTVLLLGTGVLLVGLGRRRARSA